MISWLQKAWAILLPQARHSQCAQLVTGFHLSTPPLAPSLVDFPRHRISGIPGSFVTKTAPSLMVPWPLHIVPSLRFEPLSSCSFLVFKTSSTWGLLPINKLGCQLETQLWCPWSTASVCYSEGRLSCHPSEAAKVSL